MERRSPITETINDVGNRPEGSRSALSPEDAGGRTEAPARTDRLGRPSLAMGGCGVHRIPAVGRYSACGRRWCRDRGLKGFGLWWRGYGVTILLRTDFGRARSR
jgi:hypothetical protein